MADQKLLLLKDVDDLGRKGDVVKVRAGYARNFLLPRQLGVHASSHALRLQERLQEERRKQAEEDRKESEQLAMSLTGVILSTEVKVDPEGHMYGSVSATDICRLIQEEKQLELDKKSIVLPHPIKKTGVHELNLRLKEGVEATVTLKVIPEGGELPLESSEAEESTEAPAETIEVSGEATEDAEATEATPAE